MFSKENLQQKVGDAVRRAGVEFVNVATSPAALDVRKGPIPHAGLSKGHEQIDENNAKLS
jgi:hypothetical protein